MRYPNLIFDLDDTLIDSFGQYVAAHQRVAAELSLRVPSRDELVVYLSTWEETLQRLWPGVDPAPFMARYLTLVTQYPYPAVPGVRATLAKLRELGHHLTIVTKRSRRHLALRMEQAELPMALFDGIFAVEDQPAPKPDPRCFEPVWELLGEARPERCLYVGDRLDDQRAAAGAGITFVAVGTGPEGLAVFDGHVPKSHQLDSAGRRFTR